LQLLNSNSGTAMTNTIETTIATIVSELANEQGSITTTSLQIAEHFGKRHDTVLRAISNLEAPKEWTDRNFAVSEYTDRTGRKLKAYKITRDGFTLLAMGFTGKEAMHWKLAYIEAFNQMADKLAAAQPALDATISSEQQGILYNEVCRQNPDDKKRHAAWHRFGAHFNINSYKNLPASRFEEAKAYLGMKSGFQAVKAAQEAMNSDAVRVAAYPAIGLASATAAKVWT
jgi:Rha family phage regulatory protein